MKFEYQNKKTGEILPQESFRKIMTPDKNDYEMIAAYPETEEEIMEQKYRIEDLIEEIEWDLEDEDLEELKIRDKKKLAALDELLKSFPEKSYEEVAFDKKLKGIKFMDNPYYKGEK